MTDCRCVTTNAFGDGKKRAVRSCRWCGGTGWPIEKATLCMVPVCKEGAFCDTCTKTWRDMFKERESRVRFAVLEGPELDAWQALNAAAFNIAEQFKEQGVLLKTAAEQHNAMGEKLKVLIRAMSEMEKRRTGG